MKKVIRLTENELINLVKKVVSESTQAEEPMVGDVVGSVEFIFKTGSAEPQFVNGEKWTPSDKRYLVEAIANFIKNYGTLNILKKYYNNKEFEIPKFIEFSFGTSSTGSSTVNSRVAEERRKWLVGIVKDAFRKLMPDGGPNDEQIEKIITNRTINSYTPTSADANFSDRTKMRGDINEQYGKISIKKLVERGMKPQNVRGLTGSLTNPVPTYKVERSKDWMDDIADFFGQYDPKYDIKVDSNKIYKLLQQIETYSDIIDVDNLMKELKSMTLESFINSTLSPSQIISLHNKFGEILEDSQLDPNTIQLRDGKIIIGLKGRGRKYGN